MKIIYDPRQVFYNPKNQYINTTKEINRDNFARIEETINKLKLKYEESIIRPFDFPRSHLYLAHDPDYVLWLKTKSKSLENGDEYFTNFFGYDRIKDTLTPIVNNTFEMAWISVKNSLSAAQVILNNEANLVYVGTRPPGNHAGLSFGGMHCFFNNTAITTKYLQTKTNGFVAILDLDFYHGNGTQEIFYQDNSALYISIHGNPSNHYPYLSGYEWEIGESDGKGFNINFPLDNNIKGRTYLRVLEKSLLEIENYDPDYLIVSFGSNTHKDDETGTFDLIDADYYEIGRMINQLNVPKIIIQEGGFNPQINALCVSNLIDGINY